MGMVASAATKVAPVVETAAGGSIRAGIWALVALMVPAVGAILLAIVKEWGPWKKVASDDRAADFMRLREEIVAQNGRIEKLENQVEKAKEDATIAKDSANIVRLQMVSMQAAFELVAGELERADPNNQVLQHARRLLAQAATSDLGVGHGMRKIAMLRGADE